MKLIARKPWLLIVLAFVILISSWVVLLKIALQNQPEKIIPPTHESHERP